MKDENAGLYLATPAIVFPSPYSRLNFCDNTLYGINGSQPEKALFYDNRSGKMIARSGLLIPTGSGAVLSIYNSDHPFYVEINNYREYPPQTTISWASYDAENKVFLRHDPFAYVIQGRSHLVTTAESPRRALALVMHLPPELVGCIETGAGNLLTRFNKLPCYY